MTEYRLSTYRAIAHPPWNYDEANMHKCLEIRDAIEINCETVNEWLDLYFSDDYLDVFEESDRDHLGLDGSDNRDKAA